MTRILSQEIDTSHKHSNQSLFSSSLKDDVLRNNHVKIAKTQKLTDSSLQTDRPIVPSGSNKETHCKKLKKTLPEDDGEMPPKSNEGYSSSGTVLYNEDYLDCGVTLSPLEFNCSADQRDRSGPSDTRNEQRLKGTGKDLAIVSLEDLSDGGMSVSDIDQFTDEEPQAYPDELTIDSSGNDTSTQHFEVPDIGLHQRPRGTPLCIIKLYKSQVFQKHNIYC